MKTLKYIIITFIIIFLASCEVDYFSDPNKPRIAPTHGIMNRVQKGFMDDTRDEWFSGRQSLLWVQYWNQVNYTEEDRYQYRETVNQSAWDDIYKHAQNLVDLIEQNTNEATKNDMIAYGSNETQIAAAQVMLVYIYQTAVELWGDVPYYSLGSKNESFQANQLKTKSIEQPAYAKQADIYADMLEVLKSTQAVFAKNDYVIDGDNFFNGDAKKWQKFANSLRLRIATRIGNKEHIADAITQGIMESNADNAGVKYANDAENAAPMYRAFYVDKRVDFAPSFSFVELLKGKRGPFSGIDPRLDIYVASNKDGLKLGIPIASTNKEVADFEHESLPGSAVLSSTYKEIYMEYSEVCFLMSENNGWDQQWYEKGVAASMAKWGVNPSVAKTYIATLPAATKETVLMQKYIALYMQPMEAWSEYRRTGYPNTIIKPGQTYTYNYKYKDESGIWVAVSQEYKFSPLGGLEEIPTRNKYLLNEESVNGANLKAAIESMGGNQQSTKLWWQN